MTTAYGTKVEAVWINAEWCANCGVAFGIERGHMAKLRETGRSFYCPNGHSLTYGSEIERLKRELKTERDRRAALAAERDQVEASRRAYKGQATKLRNRTLAGECPICGQHLRDVQRHVARQHPDEKPEVEA